MFWALATSCKARREGRNLAVSSTNFTENGLIWFDHLQIFLAGTSFLAFILHDIQVNQRVLVVRSYLLHVEILFYMAL